MNREVIREILLYRYRYIAGLIVFVTILLTLLTIRLDLAPTGISTYDMDSAVRSATFSLSHPFSQSLIDAPYLLLQKLSLHTFGITQFAITLPSIVLAVLAGGAFFMMAYRWFRFNVALITSLILITSSAFLTIGRSGFGDIMTTFWLSLILLAATNIVHPAGRTRLWSVIGLIALAFSIYTPLMAYPIIAIAVAGSIHPHIRYMLKRIRVHHAIIGIVAAGILLTPLAISLIARPSDILSLLGMPHDGFTMQQLWINAKFIGISFLNLGNAVVGIVPQPIFGAASLIIIILGLLRTIKDYYSARAFMLLVWLVLFIPIALLNPSKVMMCLVPAYLFMAIGVESLIREWYKLFPENPYARLAGLIPLVLLLGGIMLSNGAQYFYGYVYGTSTTRYTHQLTETRRYIDKNKLKEIPATLVVKSSELRFYDLIRRDYRRLTVTTSQSDPVERPTIIHDGASYAQRATGIPAVIVTSYMAQRDQVVLRVFTKPQ